MTTFGIVVQFDVPRNVTLRVSTCRVLSPVDALVLERGEERFGHGVVVADAGPADRLTEVMLAQRISELLRGIITPAVMVEDGISGEPVITCRHLNGPVDELSLIVIVHGPADHCPGTAVDNGRQIYPAFPRRNV